MTTPGSTDTVLTAPFDREAQILADRSRVIDRTMAWSAEYALGKLLRWLDFDKRLAERSSMPRAKAQVEVLREGVQG